jgi:hypothetical protein
MNRITALAVLIGVIAWSGVKADEDGSRFLGKLDPVTARMIGAPSDTTASSGDSSSAADTTGTDDGSSGGADAKSPDVRPSVAPSEKPPAPPLPTRRADMKGRDMTVEMAAKYPPDKFIPRTVQNRAWDAGESLVYSVDYGLYRAGTATMSVLNSEYVNGGLCYHIRTTANSNDFISKLYRVRDVVDSFIDVKGLFSRRFEKSLREGGYSSDEYVDIFQDRLIALSTKQKRALVEIPLYVQDILSTMYYIRTVDLKIGKDVTVEAYADGKVYPLKVIVHKKEKVEVSAGTFNCILVEPVMRSEGIFRQKGRLLVWLTDDSSRLPVKMTSKVAIGNIATKLESYRKSAPR